MVCKKGLVKQGVREKGGEDVRVVRFCCLFAAEQNKGANVYLCVRRYMEGCNIMQETR